MKLKRVFLFFIFSFISHYSPSQNVPLGQWNDYLSYQQGLTVCQGGGNMYCCCSSGVFSYNLTDNSLQRYNKVTGLSDIGCSVARYNSYTNTLVIGYVDGNIDLVTNNQVINIPDLENSSVQGSKIINNIYFSNNLAYISCGQGILVLDLNQDIILETCNIGIFGSALNVYATTIFNDSIFAATANGIYKTSINDPDIQNYQDWEIVSQHLPAGVYNGIVSCGTKMYASFSERLSKKGGSDEDTLFVYNTGKWSHYSSVQGTDNIYSLESSIVNNTSYLIYTGTNNINVFDTSGNLKLHIFTYGLPDVPFPNDAILDNAMNLWIADGNYGLVKSFSNYAQAQNYVPPGPFSNSIFAMVAEGATLYIAPGGYDQGENALGIKNIGVSEYSNNAWYRLIDGPKDTIPDLCCVAIDPKNPLHAFAGSYGHGVVEYLNSAISYVYDTANTNNALTNVPIPGYYDVPIAGVTFDANDNLWVTNSGTNTCLVVKKNNGIWQSFNFSSIKYFPGINCKVTNVIVTKSGAKWMIFPGSGILAYQDNGTFVQPNASNSVFINTNVGNGNLPSLTVYCLTEDLNGAIWVGTNTKVVVFYSPDNVFNGPGGWDAQNVYVQQTGYTQYLMQGQYSTCIAVDGANRKWIGTLGGGAFLMSADGTQQILNFTSTNSPLLSNNILSITIDQVNGEVFFGTDKGLVSYRGNATEGDSAFSNVYAYPDPVPHGYSGPITIKNLVTNSDVKIATVNGEIVYHTVALGGQAIWYGTNFNGERAKTGVYLVFCTSPDGTQSLVTKLLLVN